MVALLKINAPFRRSWHDPPVPIDDGGEAGLLEIPRMESVRAFEVPLTAH